MLGDIQNLKNNWLDRKTTLAERGAEIDKAENAFLNLDHQSHRSLN